jgi:hypothetical protein
LGGPLLRQMRQLGISAKYMGAMASVRPNWRAWPATLWAAGAN